MALDPYSGGPQCGTCGAYFTPGQVICSVCGAHRYGPDTPVVGPLAQSSGGQKVQRVFWWALSGAGVGLCFVVGTVFGVLHFFLHLLPIFH